MAGKTGDTQFSQTKEYGERKKGGKGDNLKSSAPIPDEVSQYNPSNDDTNSTSLFDEYRGDKKNLVQIREIILQSQEARKNLKEEIQKGIITKLENPEEGLKIVRGDILSYLNAILPRGYHINFNKAADSIEIGQRVFVVVKDGEVYLEGKDSKNTVLIGNIAQWGDVKFVAPKNKSKLQKKQEKIVKNRTKIDNKFIGNTADSSETGNEGGGEEKYPYYNPYQSKTVKNLADQLPPKTTKKKVPVVPVVGVVPNPGNNEGKINTADNAVPVNPQSNNIIGKNLTGVPKDKVVEEENKKKSQPIILVPGLVGDGGGAGKGEEKGFDITENDDNSNDDKNFLENDMKQNKEKNKEKNKDNIPKDTTPSKWEQFKNFVSGEPTEIEKNQKQFVGELDKILKAQPKNDFNRFVEMKIEKNKLKIHNIEDTSSGTKTFNSPGPNDIDTYDILKFKMIGDSTVEIDNIKYDMAPYKNSISQNKMLFIRGPIGTIDNDKRIKILIAPKKEGDNQGQYIWPLQNK